jgi:hypothetical protein
MSLLSGPAPDSATGPAADVPAAQPGHEDGCGIWLLETRKSLDVGIEAFLVDFLNTPIIVIKVM